MTTANLTKKHHFTISEGSSGYEVDHLQILLNSFYYDYQLIIDGYFGSQTKARVKLFQTHCLIDVDGIVGSKTWSLLEEIVPFSQAIHSTLRRGSRGNEVKYLQARLNEFYRIATSSIYHRTRIKVDGYFGSQTEERVRQFQIYQGLFVDGIVTVNTWGTLEYSICYF